VCFNGATRLHAWKHPTGAPPRVRASGFNGATRLHAWKPSAGASGSRASKVLQWGHASSRVETSFIIAAPINPDTLQWGHASSRVETEHSRKIQLLREGSFNGATRLHAWKRHDFEAEIRRCFASMG